ncbi:MAG: TipJ family phage tail tip protein [Phycisphaerales bacterium]
MSPSTDMVVLVRTAPDVLTHRWGPVKARPCRRGATARDLAAEVAGELGWDTDALCIIVNGAKLSDERAGRGPGAMLLEDGDDFRVAPRPGLDPGTWILIGIAILSAALSAYLTTRIRAPLPTGSNDAAGQRYVFGRFSSDAVAGDPIPVVLGRVLRHGGKVIRKVPLDGPDGDSRVQILVALGHGPFNKIGGFTDDADAVDVTDARCPGLYIQDQPISSFPGCKVSVRMGNPSQDPVAGFDDVEIIREVGVGGTTLRNTDGMDRTGGSASAEAVMFSTIDEVDAVVTRVRFRRGLYSISAGGQTNPRRVRYRVRVRTSDIGGGAGTWEAWQTVVLERAEQSEVVSAFRVPRLGGSPARLDVQAERITAEPTLVGDVDEMTFDSVVEVRDAELTYPSIALLAVELVASEQLTTVPRMSSDCEGFAGCLVFDPESDPAEPSSALAYSNNPADLAITLLTNETWGLGGTYAGVALDPGALETLFAWKLACDETVERHPSIGGMRPRFACNIVLADQRDGIDWLRVLCRAGRCTPATVGASWRFIHDRPQETPVEIFTEATIAADDNGDPDFTLTRELTTGGIVRPNRLTAQVRNDLADGRDDLVVFPEYETLWLATEPVREQGMKLEGVTDPEQAHAELVYLLKRIRALGRTVRLVTTKPMPAVQPGDRFDVACDLPGWGLASGRLGPGSTASVLVLDRPVTFTSGVTYTVRVVQLDGTVLTGTIKKGAGTWHPGEGIDLAASLGTTLDAYAEFALGPIGAVTKPFICTRLTPVGDDDKKTLLWQVEGIEYAPSVYTAEPLDLAVPNPSVLTGIVTPPGPLVSLTAHERTFGGRVQVELGWTQSPADVENTATFRVYRRISGTESWVPVPEPRVGRRSYVLDIIDVDRAYQFIVVAVSAAGAQLSPYDPRHPLVNLVYGLSALPPPPPTGLTLTPVAGNLYDLTWDAVDGAVGYQVLGGGEPGTGLPNDGAEDCLVAARTIDPELLGLRLAPGHARTFWVRSVAPSGRLSFTASSVTEATPPDPAGESGKDSADYDLTSDGTLTNLLVDGTDLVLDDADADGVFLGPEEDPGTLSLSRLMVAIATLNGAEDPALADAEIPMPSIAADQWGIVSVGPAVVGMLMPPWPDSEQTWLVEARTHDGVLWSDWEAVTPGGEIHRTFQKWQVRVTLRRAHFPYGPALAAVRVEVTE